ncbi:hypothetical protein PIB30_083966 [Stylosanthes scabra]|uniref:Uncharacterized protein n=1 Tax=Stylosanthes scabra TaxID=79078 RepID=A0ABU6YRC6_9FABA|nr:hypothetical protein [Stylosanthes scabra]
MLQRRGRTEAAVGCDAKRKRKRGVDLETHKTTMAQIWKHDGGVKKKEKKKGGGGFDGVEGRRERGATMDLSKIIKEEGEDHVVRSAKKRRYSGGGGDFGGRGDGGTGFGG